MPNYYFLREEGLIFFSRFGKRKFIKWENAKGSIFYYQVLNARPEYGLAIAPLAEDGHYHMKDSLWIYSNDPTSGHTPPIAAVWDYICHYMEYGVEGLPPPGEGNWWMEPLYHAYLTPREAWHHYAPWYTGKGASDERKRQRIFLFWLVALPYNLFAATCWYVMCLLFRVSKQPPVPAEVEALLRHRQASASGGTHD